MLSAVEGEGRDAALAEIAGLVGAEVAALRAHRESLPAVDPARERAEGAALALFDHSEQGALFRRYELATERYFYRALAEVRKAGALDLAEAAMAPQALPGSPISPLASFGAGPPAEARPDRAAPPAPEPKRAAAPVASSPAARMLPPSLPARWAQDEAFGKNLLNFIEPDAPRAGRRPRLPKR